MTTTMESLYTAAMALNNIGISLLQRGAADKGVQAIGFAVVLIRANVSSSEPEISTTHLNEVLNKTNQSLATCQLSDDLLCTESVGGAYRVITHDDIFRFTKDSLDENLGGSHTMSSLIRVELDATSISDMKTYYPGIESSILLQNLGKVYMKMALKDTSTENAREKQHCACGLFKLSYYILETLYNVPYPQHHDHLFPQLLPMMIISLQSLIFTTSVLGLTSETANFSTHLLQLCDRFYSECQGSNYIQDKLAKAA